MSGRKVLFDSLWSTPLGRCFVHNLLDSLDLQMLSSDRATNVLDDLAVKIAASGKDPLEEVGAIADAHDAYLLSRIKPSRLPDFVATSFNATYLVSILRTQPDVRLRGLATAISNFYATVRSGNITDLRDRERRIHTLLRAVSTGSADGLIDLDLTGTLLGPKRFGWFTTYGQGDEEAGCWLDHSSWAARGDATRDILGLIHYGSTSVSPHAWEPILIATYVVPRAAFGAAPVFARPNGIDGIGGTRFRARFGKIGDPIHPWGRTVNLAKLHGPRPFRGGKEIVIANVVPASIIRFTIAGAVWVPRGDVLGTGDDHFETIVAGKRQQSTRERKFLAL